MLIDTILRGVPMPKIFLWNEIRHGATYRRVIDGQQRLGAILAFLADQFELTLPYEGEHQGSKFSTLPGPVQNAFLQYKIDFNEAIEFSENEVREVYSRVNKYSLPLNRQELRQADYPGQFLELSLTLSQNEYLDESWIFSPANRRRMGDVEYVSELLAGMLAGPQDKKDDLDNFYYKYRVWPDSQVTATRVEFENVLSDMKAIFSAEFELRKTRFRQKSDFYSLFLSVMELKRAGHTIVEKDLGPLRGDLNILDRYIAPESDVSLLSEYAIKCVSQANSVSSRAWRRNFLMMLLSGTYKSTPPKGRDLVQISALANQLAKVEGLSLFAQCAACGSQLNWADVSNGAELSWPDDTSVYQVSNACWRCPDCR
jgi:hypothetical protein